MRTLAVFDGIFARRHPALITIFALLLAALVAAFDHLTGTELSISIFYLGPVSLAAWYGCRVCGYGLAIVSAGVWLLLEMAGHIYSHEAIAWWNALVRLGFFLLTCELLTALRRHLDAESVMARVDALTGVLNSRAFREGAEELCGIGARHARPLVLAYVDLDNFKTVNDTMGHAEGDQALKSVAGSLLAAVRRTDLVGRLGGDEFALLLPETSREGAAALLEKLRESLDQTAALGKWPIGFSIGAVAFAVPPASSEGAIRMADDLMYRVKKSGKGRTEIAEQGP